jgi:hypothetical protein
MRFVMQKRIQIGLGDVRVRRKYASVEKNGPGSRPPVRSIPGSERGIQSNLANLWVRFKVMALIYKD